MSDVLSLVPYKMAMWEFLYNTTSDGIILCKFYCLFSAECLVL